MQLGQSNTLWPRSCAASRIHRLTVCLELILGRRGCINARPNQSSCRLLQVGRDASKNRQQERCTEKASLSPKSQKQCTGEVYQEGQPQPSDAQTQKQERCTEKASLSPQEDNESQCSLRPQVPRDSNRMDSIQPKMQPACMSTRS